MSVSRYVWMGLAVLGLTGLANAQSLEIEDVKLDKTSAQVGLVTGWFSGGSLGKVTVDDEPVTIDTDGGLLAGVRFGQDWEYLGWEATVAGVFQNMDLDADPLADIPSADNANWILTNINLLWYPFGEDLADGKVKPYLTAGPGLAWLDTDFDEADSELMFTANAGPGIKWFLGEDEKVFLKFDYRWYYFMGTMTDNLKGSIYRQEISGGIGISF